MRLTPVIPLSEMPVWHLNLPQIWSKKFWQFGISLVANLDYQQWHPGALESIWHKNRTWHAWACQHLTFSSNLIKEFDTCHLTSIWLSSEACLCILTFESTPQTDITIWLMSSETESDIFNLPWQFDMWHLVQPSNVKSTYTLLISFHLAVGCQCTWASV